MKFFFYRQSWNNKFLQLSRIHGGHFITNQTSLVSAGAIPLIARGIPTTSLWTSGRARVALTGSAGRINEKFSFCSRQTSPVPGSRVRPQGEESSWGTGGGGWVGGQGGGGGGKQKLS